MNNSANFCLARRQFMALSLAAPILSYAQSCPVGIAPVGGTTTAVVGGHGIGLDFIGTSNIAVKASAFTSSNGSIILASVGRGGLADFATSTVSDNKNNGNYSQVGTAHSYRNYPSSGTALYTKANVAGGSGHVVSASKPSAQDEVTVIAAEFKNVTRIVDSQWVEDLTSPNTSANVSTTGPAVLAAFWWGDNSNGELNPAVDAAWTVLDHTSSLASNHVQGASAYRVVTSAGIYSINWTPSTAQGAQLWIVAMQ